MQAANDQWAAEINEVNRIKLQRCIQQLQDHLADGEAQLAELEQQLAKILAE